MSKKRLTVVRRKLRDQFNLELDTIRCRIDVDEQIFDQFQKDKNTPEYQRAFEEESPLVSVCIATYNRGELLTERTIPSLLNQTYSNVEVIVVGDCCQDDTQDRIDRIDDPRLTFVNLPQRGTYPPEPNLRWMVAGTTPVNHALTLSNGTFITHLDDDDRHSLDRIEKLVAFAQENRLDFVWHPFHRETEIDHWKLVEAANFTYSHVTTSSSFYHHWLTRIPWDINAYRFHEPGDWNRFRKFRYLGVNAARYPEPLLHHYKERSQRNV